MKNRSNTPLMPRNAQIEISTACNIDCLFCAKGNFIPRRMPYEQFVKIIEAIPSLKTAHLQGEGEPLINKDIFKMLRYLKKKQITSSITSNMLLADETIIRELVEMNLLYIGISLESIIPSQFEKFRRGADFSLFKKNLEFLMTTIREKGIQLPVVFQVIVFRSTIAHFQEIIQFAENLGVQEIHFNQLILKEDYFKNYGQDIKKEVLRPKDREEFRRLYPRAVYWQHTDCNLTEQVYINVEGNILPCCFIKYSDIGLGNILEKSFKDIFNSNTFNTLRKNITEGNYPHYCQGCNFAAPLPALCKGYIRVNK